MAHDPSAQPAAERDLRLGLTVYGCEQDEANLFHELAQRFGIATTTMRDPVSEAAVRSRPGTRCVSVGHTSELTRRHLRALKESGAEYICTRSIGLDHIDLGAAEDLGITVENVVYAPDGVADFTVMLILMVIRDATEVVSSAPRSEDRHGPDRGGVRGRDLRDMTVGVVGVGHIGRAVIRRLQGFGCRVLACSNRPKAVAGADVMSFEELLAASDLVTLHVPLTADTHHLIGCEQLASMKPGAILVNTARGALVDTGALISALESGRLGGAALDVLEGEQGLVHPDRTAGPVDHRFFRELQQLPNAIVTPHVAYRTVRTLRDTVETTLTNCLIFERNQENAETQGRDPVRGLLGGA